MAQVPLHELAHGVIKGNSLFNELFHRLGLSQDTADLTARLVSDGELGVAGLREGVESLTNFQSGFEEQCLRQVQVSDSHVLTPILVRNEITLGSLSALLFIDIAAFVHPVIIKVLGHVVADVVGKDNNDTLALTNLVLLDVFDGSPECCAG